MVSPPGVTRVSEFKIGAVDEFENSYLDVGPFVTPPKARVLNPAHFSFKPNPQPEFTRLLPDMSKISPSGSQGGSPFNPTVKRESVIGVEKVDQGAPKGESASRSAKRSADGVYVAPTDSAHSPSVNEKIQVKIQVKIGRTLAQCCTE